jgi:hypothetical protein
MVKRREHLVYAYQAYMSEAIHVNFACYTVNPT